jgi:hypothetical protein
VLGQLYVMGGTGCRMGCLLGTHVACLMISCGAMVLLRQHRPILSDQPGVEAKHLKHSTILSAMFVGL